MPEQKQKIYLVGITVIVILFVCDRIIKHAIMTGAFAPAAGMYANQGIAFSIGISKFMIGLLLGCAVTVLATMVIIAAKRHQTKSFILLVGILAGAVSNIIDRLWWGAVIDYIYIGWWLPVFNIADVLIAGSAGLWLLLVL